MPIPKKKINPVEPKDSAQDVQDRPVVRQVIEVVEVLDETPSPSQREISNINMKVEVSRSEPVIPPEPPVEVPDVPVEKTVGELMQEVDTKPSETVTESSEDVSVEPEPSIQEDEMVTDKQKATVESLFSKTEPAVLPEISVHTPNNSGRSIFVWAMIMLVIALVIGGALVLFTGKTNRAPQLAPVQPTTAPTAVATPTATPTPVAMDKDALKVQVLNGGGKTGAAGKMKELLTTKGYKVANTGNTEEYTFEKSEVHVKPALSANLTEITDDLKEDYTVGESAADLPADSTYDVQIIVGKE